jgi:hypothetical protein
MYAKELNTLTSYATDARIYMTTPSGFRIYDNTMKDTREPKLISSTTDLISQYSQLIPYHTHYLLAASTKSLKVVNIASDIPVIENTFPFGNDTLLKKSMSYDAETEKIYTLVESGSKYYVKVLDVADSNAIHWDAGNIRVGLQGRAITSNGTDVFVVGRNIGNGNMIMVSFANPEKPVIVDHAVSIDGDCDNTAFYKGYVYCGGFGAITIYKVTPSSAGSTKTGTTGLQNQQREQQSGSSGTGDQTLVDQVADILNRALKYLYRHLPVQL